MINKKYVNVLYHTYGLVPTSLSCTVPLYVCLCVLCFNDKNIA